MKVDFGKLLELTRPHSKTGDCAVYANNSEYFNEDLGEIRGFVGFSVVIDGIVGSGETFEEALENYKRNDQEEKDKRIADARKVLEREGVK